MRTNKTYLRLQLLLKKKHMTQKELSSLTGLTESAICKYLQGNRAPNAPSLIKIADATGVSPSWILGYGNDEEMEMI